MISVSIIYKQMYVIELSINVSMKSPEHSP